MDRPQIICIGEYLLDLIGSDYTESVAEADRYRRLAGGSPANLAMNLARLGVDVGLAASVGDDATGNVLIEAAGRAGVRTAAIRRVPEPTTLILVTRSRAVSDFQAYRSADRLINSDQIPDDWFGERPMLHTTAFALSREPARATILAAAERVAARGGTLSIDLNYAGKIWPDRLEALWVITQYLRTGGGKATTLVKCSEVDYERLFQEVVDDKQEAVNQLRDLGAGLVCLTLGEEGSYIAPLNAEAFALSVRPVEVRDTTGAGDAFWSGFLAAHLAGKGWPDCARAGRAVAERKLTRVGPFTEQLKLDELLGD